ncbi:MAG: fatty acid desaturase [Bryobacteraceae bacterium]
MTVETSPLPFSREFAGQDFEAQAANLVSDLHRPNPRIFWADLILTSLAGWICFVAALQTGRAVWQTGLAVTIAALAFYRGLCFLHEIAHIRQRLLPGFEITWNFLLGVPLLMPSIVYVGVHQNHHMLSTYGTDNDPEYLPFAGKPFMVAVFILQSLLLPALMVLRFLVLAPVGLVAPRLHRWLAEHATALSMNVKYRREVSDATLGRIRRWEIAVLLIWGACFALAAGGLIPWQAFAVWYAASAIGSLINTLRALAAHRYETTGAPRDRAAQLGDSVDIPGGLWSELWAPVGLRYHAVHHFFPGVPYHNLPTAYRRLSLAIPAYRHITKRSLASSLRDLVGR